MLMEQRKRERAQELVKRLEKTAVIADFLLRFEKVNYAFVTAVYGSKLMLSLRTSNQKTSASDIMRRME